MKNAALRKGLVAGVVSAGVIVGVAAGFFAAHMMMGDMSGMKGMDMKSMQGMEGAQGMSTAPPAAVAIPTVARQLIGDRSAPAAYAELEKEVLRVCYGCEV